MIRDPALRFWVDYVEAEGGLCESDAETAQVILPAALQRTFRLPEALTVTSDPDIAQDEGALLLAAGHPALDIATSAVLAKGDAGIAFLRWPHPTQPSRSVLLEHARADIMVEHGRIDPTRDPIAVYYPLLRVGVLVTYTLDERFQEREEVWIDGRTGHVVSGEVVRAVQSQGTLSRPDVAAPTVAPDLARAVAAAHEVLDARSALRARALERQARVGLAEEQTRAQGYYDAVLATIERRRKAAPPERQRLLVAQAEATEIERGRRLREIAAKFEASRTFEPYRLNLIFVSALAFAVDVRRGERRYPLTLYWLISAATFAPACCPACAATERLVAGRALLGCRRCVTRA